MAVKRAGRGRTRGCVGLWGPLLVLALGLVFLFSCEKKVEKLEAWPFEERAIKVKYKADMNLNIHNEEDHTLFVCIYQLTESKAFKDLTTSKEGVIKLLDCQRFDASIASSTRLIVHPGEEEIKQYDRAEEAKWVGVVAGYYNLWPEHVYELIQVPTTTEKSGIIFKKEKVVIRPLNLKLYFGPEEIQRMLE